MYKISKLEQTKGLFHVFSTVENGNMSLMINQKQASSQQVIQNRKSLFNKIGIDFNNAMTLWLEHGNKVIEANENWLGNTFINKTDPQKGDAIITNSKNVYLVVTFADCVPIILFDPIKKAVGVIHAGWKGADLQIVVKTIERMTKKYKTDPKSLLVGIGPSIRKGSYVQKDPQQKGNPKWKKFIEQVSENGYEIDIVGYNKKQLVDEGVLEQNIFDCEIDTAQDSRFFSHYVDSKSVGNEGGRFMVIVGIH